MSVATRYYDIIEGGIRLYCHVQPKASRDAIAGVHNDRLKIQITAPPSDGQANEHLRRFIAKQAGVAKSGVTLVSGHTSRQKTLLITGIHCLPDGFP